MRHDYVNASWRISRRHGTYEYVMDSWHSWRIIVQGGEDSWDPLICRWFSTKEPLNIGHFCGKWPIKIRDPMSLRHPVRWSCSCHFEVCIYICVWMRREHVNELWHIWKCFGTYEWVMAHLNKLKRCIVDDPVGNFERYIWMSHGACECHGTHKWVMAHMNESWHIWMSHGTHEELSRSCFVHFEIFKYVHVCIDTCMYIHMYICIHTCTLILKQKCVFIYIYI